MSESRPPAPPVAPEPEKTGTTERMSEWFSTRAGGVLIPLAAAILAFFVGGVVILFAGHSPFGAYKAIFEGTGLTYPYLWLTGQETRAGTGRALWRWAQRAPGHLPGEIGRAHV